jgi:hypothetical protein
VCKVDESVIQVLLEEPLLRTVLIEKLKLIRAGDPAHFYPTLIVYRRTRKTLEIFMYFSMICIRG